MDDDTGMSPTFAGVHHRQVHRRQSSGLVARPGYYAVYDIVGRVRLNARIGDSCKRGKHAVSLGHGSHAFAGTTTFDEPGVNGLQLSQG